MALSEAAREKRNAYWRAWYASHKEQVKASHERSWEKKITQEGDVQFGGQDENDA